MNPFVEKRRHGATEAGSETENRQGRRRLPKQAAKEDVSAEARHKRSGRPARFIRESP